MGHKATGGPRNEQSAEMQEVVEIQAVVQVAAEFLEAVVVAMAGVNLALISVSDLQMTPRLWSGQGSAHMCRSLCPFSAFLFTPRGGCARVVMLGL